MKIDTLRQSWLTAFLTLTAITAAAFVRRSTALYDAERVVNTHLPLLGGYIRDFQASSPVWSAALIIFVILFGGLYIGHLCARNALYRINCFMAIPFFGVIAGSMLLGESSLPAFTATLLFILAIRRFYASCSVAYRFGDIFQGAALIGVLPFIYSPALVLILIVPVAVVVLQRSMREAVVALFGLALPPALICYIAWGCGGVFGEPLIALFSSFVTPCGFSIFIGTSPLTLVLMCAALFILLCSITILFVENRSVSKRARCLLLFNAAVCVVSFGMFFSPSATAGVLSLVAVTASIVMPILFVVISEKAANIIYIALIFLCFVQAALYFSL